MQLLTKTALIAAAAFGLLAAPSAMAKEQGDDRALTEGEAKLAKLLEGRVAGEPENCIRTFPSRSFTIINDTALVYRQGKTLWVNYTRTPDAIDDDDVLVIRKFGSGTRLCRLDQVTTQDRFAGFFTGIIFLDDFVPYRAAEEG